MRIILSSNPYRDRGLRAAREAGRVLCQAGAEVVVCLPFVPGKEDRLELPGELSLGNLQDELPKADALICFGGDGTILHAARDATLFNIPVLGVNLGSVGFIAELERGEISALGQIPRGNYTLEERMLLRVQVCRGGKRLTDELALNDAVFSKGSVSRVAEVEVMADGVVISRIVGDGVIVSTPTGSTAYSMSAGGPIVEPTSRALIITPVCAHQLSARSLVLDPGRMVTIRLPKGSRKSLHLSIDGGRVMRLNGGERAEITRAEQTTRLIRLKERNFYQILNQKLGGNSK